MPLRMTHPNVELPGEAVDEAQFEAVWRQLGWELDDGEPAETPTVGEVVVDAKPAKADKADKATTKKAATPSGPNKES